MPNCKVFFFCLTPPPYTQFRDLGVWPAPRGAFGLRGKEVVFLEVEWPGFEPRTSSIRRGRSIHSATSHLALQSVTHSCFSVTKKPFLLHHSDHSYLRT